MNAATAQSDGADELATRSTIRMIDGYRCELVDLKAADIVSICKPTLKVDKALLGRQTGPDPDTLSIAVQQLLQIVQEAGDGLPEQLKDKDLKINDIDFQERYSARNDIAGQFGECSNGGSCAFGPLIPNCCSNGATWGTS